MKKLKMRRIKMANIITTILSPVIIGTAKKALKSLAKHLWDHLWTLLVESIQQVEATIKNDPELKKETVVRRIMNYVETSKKFSKLQLWAVRKFIELVIDKMIDQMNDNCGHKWVETITDLKKYWEGRIPYLS